VRIAKVSHEAGETARAGDVRKLSGEVTAGIDQLRDLLIRTVRASSGT
jgi:hypothetical protein